MEGIVGPLAFSPRTEFEGLYLCGASTLSHGVAGVTQSGIDAAKAVLNCRTRNILKQGGASLTFLLSEDVSAWPKYLRKKMERGEVAREEGSARGSAGLHRELHRVRAGTGEVTINGLRKQS